MLGVTDLMPPLCIPREFSREVSEPFQSVIAITLLSWSLGTSGLTPPLRIHCGLSREVSARFQLSTVETAVFSRSLDVFMLLAPGRFGNAVEPRLIKLMEPWLDGGKADSRLRMPMDPRLGKAVELQLISCWVSA